ncbi:MAG: cupin domain-containing protein [Planctomycetia bacterium]|nr:cupin domain-containing protein [Planctomycetia bacterium]
MKTPAIRKFRQKLAQAQHVYGLWVTLESASITEMAVGLGLDWVVVDAEHGHLDWSDILEHIRATVRSETVVLVRIAELNLGLIKRALDIGADGVVVPWIESVEQLRQAVSFAHYPPAGVRGIGAERATCWGRCFSAHVDDANEHVLVVPIIETVTGGQSIELLCQVEGVDVFFLGPADYSSTAGYPGQWEGPGVAQQLLAIKDTVRRHGKHCGIVATSNENLLERREQGFSMLAVGLDGGLLLRSLSGALVAIGQDRQLTPDFLPDRIPSSAAKTPLATTRPAGFTPDRPEVINPRSSARRVELERGVIFQPLVGAHNNARKLTTGIVNFMPGAVLPYHTHPHGEAITLLSGEAAVEIEGRRYALEPLDNVYIRSGLAHAAFNTSASKPAQFHIAMDSHEPERTLVEDTFARRLMAQSENGPSGGEHVSRHATTPWYEPNAGARFQDYFNRDLGKSGMSGGYGIFQPGGRLPCHLHDFDESITIVEGTATCVVEGREYQLSDCATALAPRGRCHYFINHSKGPMAMIWVYAGDLPQRLVLDEKCCTLDGCPR